MAKVDIQDGSIDVDAATIARGLDLDSSRVPALMKAGDITSVCERGEGSDAGRYRLTFFHGNRRFRLTVDMDGAILAAEHAGTPSPSRASSEGELCEGAGQHGS